MAFGAPGGSALSYSTVQPAAVQGAEAFAAAPQANADAAQKMAEAKAGTQVAQEQGVEAATKKQDIANANLYKTASMPGIENSAGGLKLLKAAADAAGLEIPKTVNGLPDVAALKKMSATPAKPISQWTPAEISAAKALNPTDRVAILPDDAPDSLKTDPAITPITEKGVEALMKPVTMAETAIGKGVGNMQGLQTAALSAYKALAAKGGDTSVIDPYLNATHTALSDEFKNQAAGQLVDAQIANLHSLGIYRADETGLREKSIEEKKREFDNLGANQKAKISLQQQQYARQASQFAQKMSMQQQNLSARYASISNSANANTLRAGALGINMYENQIKDTEKAQGDAERTLTSTANSINGYLNTANADLTNPTYLGLVKQAADLRQTIDTNAPQLQAAKEAARGGIANIYQGITGQQAAPAGATNVNVNLTVPGGPAGQKFGTQSNSPPPGAKTGTIHTAKGDVKGYTVDGKTFFDMSGKPIQ